MSYFDDLAERVRRGDPISLPIAMMLSALTPIQRIGMWQRKLGAPVWLDGRVISIGNITAGGTGKTPAVIERVQREMAAGCKVAVLTRGYGTRHAAAVEVVESTGSVLRPGPWLGDEPELIARRVPGVVIARGKDRVAAGKMARAEFGCNTFVLDDGFQYLQLGRNEDIVVIDATNPFGNKRLMPRGILREPLSALSRATSFILTRCDQAPDASELVRQLRRSHPDKALRTTRHVPTGLWRVADGGKVPLDTLRGEPVCAACAIGNPEAFFKTLTGLGADIAERMPFRDHEVIPAEALSGSVTTVVTEKDAVRMTHAPENVLALQIDLQDWSVPGGDR